MDKFKNIPLWLIIIALIVAWPVGIVLIVLKYYSKATFHYDRVGKNASILETNKETFNKLNKMKSKVKLFKILSIIQFIIAILFFCALMSDIATGNTGNIEGGIIANVFAFAVLLPLCICYFKKNSLIKKIESYQNLILIRDIYDTQKLATYLSESREKVINFVVYMIREGYLELDLENDNIVKPKEYVDPAGIFSIVCQSCGANNKYIKGKTNKCEYCGTVLNLNKI